MTRIKQLLQVFIDAGQAWGEDRASLYAAAIAYFTVFSLAPLLALSIAISGFFLGGRFDVQAQVVIQVEQIVGTEAAEFIRGLLENVVQGASSATVLSLALLLYAASGVFNQLKRALDLIFGVIPKPMPGLQGALTVIKARALAFGMVFVMGVALLGSLLLNTAFAVLNRRVEAILPGVAPLLPSVNFVVVPLILIVLFALLFRTLPDARIYWRDLLVGSIVTTVLFLVGVALINLYLRFSNPASVYGAASSIVVILLWIYFSAQIVLYGAEFTKVFANQLGRQITPSENAMYLAERLLERAEEANNAFHVERPPRSAPQPPSPTAVSPFDTPEPSGQTRRQVAFGMIGLAVGLFLGYVSSLRGEE